MTWGDPGVPGPLDSATAVATLAGGGRRLRRCGTVFFHTDTTGELLLSALDDIRASVEAARDAVDAARNLVTAAMQQAQDKAQQVAGLGLEGVAATVQAAYASLEAAASGLGTTREAADGVVNALGQVTSGSGGAKATAQRLGGVVGQLAQAAGGVESANNSVHEAHTYSQQAEIDSLTAVIGGVFDGVVGARESLEDAKGRTEAYRQHVESVSRGNL